MPAASAPGDRVLIRLRRIGWLIFDGCFDVLEQGIALVRFGAISVLILVGGQLFEHGIIDAVAPHESMLHKSATAASDAAVVVGAVVSGMLGVWKVLKFAWRESVLEGSDE
ncbi:MAG: hypothetical protein EPO65_12045 [Dehalococcoidia bacterium]|nr:MAG: hypothetical protein EPO65_12045 [Dehalococcoidia bacterium]